MNDPDLCTFSSSVYWKIYDRDDTCTGCGKFECFVLFISLLSVIQFNSAHPVPCVSCQPVLRLTPRTRTKLLNCAATKLMLQSQNDFALLSVLR